MATRCSPEETGVGSDGDTHHQEGRQVELCPLSAEELFTGVGPHPFLVTVTRAEELFTGVGPHPFW